MRVRYKFFNDDRYIAECDMTLKKATKLYDKLQGNLLCLWAELVCEEDDEVKGYEYMDVVKGFYHERKTAEFLYQLGARAKI